jgi:hypothetical protein
MCRILGSTLTQTSGEFTQNENWFICLLKCCYLPNNVALCTAVRTIVELFHKPEQSGVKQYSSKIHYKDLAEKLWNLFLPASSSVHYVAAELFIQLYHYFFFFFF